MLLVASRSSRATGADVRATDGEAADIDPGLVNFHALAAWMDGQGFPAGTITNAQRIGSGTQNVLVRFARSGHEYVLRRGPRHLRPNSNAALRKEVQLLNALSATGVPRPEVLAACLDDEAVLGGALFYLMAPVDGFNATAMLPRLHADDPTIRRGMGFAAIDALAALAAVDHVSVGLGQLGRPEGFLDRQVGRWLSELESYEERDGYPGNMIPFVETVADWLERNRPKTFAPGILHGDFHLANLMYAYDGPHIAAIVDWEMCTVGDPLLDLGWLLATWPRDEPTGPVAGALGAAGGLPTADELVARYAQRSERDLAMIDWYVVLACFKLGIVLEGTYARSLAGKADRATGERLHAMTLGLFGRARTLISAT